MKAPRRYFDPLAIGAPRPLLELPSRLERMIHFVPPHNEKVRAKAPELVGQVDVVLGNLEDAIPVESKQAAREGLIAMAKTTDFGSTGLWARVNALNSPCFIDDMTRLMGEIGDKLDVVMAPKIEGEWDIHFIDQYLALLEARYGLKRPILVHAILETAGRQQCRGDRRRFAAHARDEPRPGGPCRIAGDEDDARRRRPSRLSGACRRGRTPCRARELPAGSLALHDRAHGRRLRGERHQGVLWAVRRFLRPSRLRSPIPQRLPARLRRRLDPASKP